MNRVGQLCALWSPQFLPATLRSNFFFLWCLQFLPRPHPPLSEGTNFSKTDIFTLRTGLSHLDFPRETKKMFLSCTALVGTLPAGMPRVAWPQRRPCVQETCPTRFVKKTGKLRGHLLPHFRLKQRRPSHRLTG